MCRTERERGPRVRAVVKMRAYSNRLFEAASAVVRHTALAAECFDIWFSFLLLVLPFYCYLWAQANRSAHVSNSMHMFVKIDCAALMFAARSAHQTWLSVYLRKRKTNKIIYDTNVWQAYHLPILSICLLFPTPFGETVKIDKMDSWKLSSFRFVVVIVPLPNTRLMQHALHAR